MISGTIKTIPILEFLKRDINGFEELYSLDKTSPEYKQMYSRITFKRRYTHILDRIEENKKWIYYYNVKGPVNCVVLHTDRIKDLENQLKDLEKEITEKYV